MTLLAALSCGVAVYLAVGLATGRPASPARRRPSRRRAGQAQLWLTQAGVALTPRQFWAGSAAVGTAAFVVLAAATSTPAVVVVPAVAVALAPRAYFARRRAQRLREVARAWPDGLRDLVAAVSAGLSLPQALTRLAESGPEPLQRAFARFPLRLRILGLAGALEVVKAELAEPSSDRVIEVLILAHERGGRIIAELLRDLAEASTEDTRTAEQIDTAGLEQRLNARSVFVLPWLVLATLTARPGHFRAFYQSGGGFVVVAVGAALSLFGMWLLSRLEREPVEERVLADTRPAR